jgi:hypothetical protein
VRKIFFKGDLFLPRKNNFAFRVLGANFWVNDMIPKLPFISGEFGLNFALILLDLLFIARRGQGGPYGPRWPLEGALRPKRSIDPFIEMLYLGLSFLPPQAQSRLGGGFWPAFGSFDRIVPLWG